MLPNVKSEKYDWRRHPITMELFQALRERDEGVKEEILHGALDSEPRLLAYKAGYVQAIRDILSLEIFEESHGD